MKKNGQQQIIDKLGCVPYIKMNVAVCIIVSSNAFPSPTSMIDSEGAWSVEDIIRWDELEKANVEVRSQL